MTADYSSEIKIAIFQSITERQRTSNDLSANCGRIAAKTARFNSKSSKIIKWKFVTFVHDVAGLLPFNLLEVASLSANLLSNATAKSKGRYWRRMQTAP